MEIGLIQKEIVKHCKSGVIHDYQGILAHFKENKDITEFVESEQGIDWLMWLLGFNCSK